MRVWGKARTAAEIGQDMTTELIGNESGLEADYPLDEGQGLTATDQTPNGNDGTLAGLNGGLPAWVVPGNAGIDLGDDGITANSTRSSTAGALQFQGSSYVSLPGGLIDDAEPSETLEAWFQTTSGGVILGFQSSSASSDFAPDQWIREIYVGTDGRLYAGGLCHGSRLGRAGHIGRPRQRWPMARGRAGDRRPVRYDDRLPRWPAPRDRAGDARVLTRGASTRSGPDTRSTGRRRLTAGTASWARSTTCGCGARRHGRRDRPGHDHRAERGRTGPGGRLSARRGSGGDRVRPDSQPRRRHAGRPQRRSPCLGRIRQPGPRTTTGAQ